MKFLRRKCAAEYVREAWGVPCAAQTLAKLAVVGGGPVFMKAGRYPLYRPEDLDAWASAKFGPLQTSTTDVRHSVNPVPTQRIECNRKDPRDA